MVGSIERCLACPIDGTAFAFMDAGTLRCMNGHTFDRAREGYHNLLVVQHKASRDPGDTKTMVAARHRFLEGGHFAPIADHVAATVSALASASTADDRTLIVDAGCGEGYYIEHISRGLPAPAAERINLAGIDISKWAIQAAAKRSRAQPSAEHCVFPCFWAVASNRHLPFALGSVDVIVSMFGFPLWDAFATAQPTGGRILLVDSGPDHLIELRSIIYPVVAKSDAPTLEAAFAAGYHLDDEVRLRFQTTLPTRDAIADLLAMTPHDHRAPQAGRAAIAEIDHLPVTGDVVVRVLTRV